MLTNNNTISFAKTLRRNMTMAEKIIWKHLSNRQQIYKFRRQQPLGPYIGDFVCFELKLVVEIDGGQHSSEKDFERTQYLEEKGYRVIRFWNNEILENTEGVLYMLQQSLTPHPDLLPQGEKEISL